jgi:hypothetical protein
MGEEKDQFESLMVFMPEGWEEEAKALGALRRARQVKTAEDLLKLILLYLTEGKGPSRYITKTDGKSVF